MSHRVTQKLLQQGAYVILFSAALPLLAQGGAPAEPTPDVQGYTLSVRSQLVLLDTVVRDKKGNIVHGLKRDDFTILQDDVIQPIVAFDSTDVTGAGKSNVPIGSTEELQRKAPKAPVTILVLDELTTRFEDEYFARYSLAKYLDGQGETLNTPTMLLARTYDRTMVLHDYTTSKAEVLDALKRHLVGSDWRARTPDQSANLFSAAFASLIEVAKATQGHQGHKNLVWIGRGFPTVQWSSLSQQQEDSLQTTIITCSNLLRSARITLYALDPSGVVVAHDSTVDNATGALSSDDPFGGQIDFDTMARETGGLAMHGQNDVDRLIRDAVDDGESFYTLAYRPPTFDGDPRKQHQTKIVMKDPNLTATTRSGFYYNQSSNTPDRLKAADLSRANRIDLSAALSTLLVFTDIPMEIKRVGQTDQYRLILPVSALDFQEVDGKLSTQIDLIAVGFDRLGKPLTHSSRSIHATLPTLAAGTAEDRHITLMSKVSGEGAARIRFIVRTHSGQKIGAENYFLVDRSLLKDPATGLKAAKPSP